MSTAQRAAVLADHRLKAEEGDPMHYEIAARVKAVIDKQQQGSSRKTGVNTRLSFNPLDAEVGDVTGITSQSMEKARRSGSIETQQKSRTYFFDYNTVEQILLACAIFICLAGIMFESDRFQSVDSTTDRYDWQYELITWCTIFVFFFSFFYYFTVLLSEIAGCTPKFIKKLFGNRRTAAEKAVDLLQEQQDEHVEMTVLMNPLRVGAQTGGGNDQKNKQIIAEMEEENNLLKDRMVRLLDLQKQRTQKAKQAEVSNRWGNSIAGSTRKKKRKKKMGGSVPGQETVKSKSENAGAASEKSTVL